MRDPAAQNYEILRKRLNKSEVIEKLYHVTSNKEKKSTIKSYGYCQRRKNMNSFGKKKEK